MSLLVLCVPIFLYVSKKKMLNSICSSKSYSILPVGACMYEMLTNYY